jgi:hypothetical protein
MGWKKELHLEIEPGLTFESFYELITFLSPIIARVD